MNYKIIIAILTFLILPTAISAQIAAGGSFSLEKSVVATGGGTSSNGSFNLSGTTGQNAAGTVNTNVMFDQVGGFWTFDGFAPTAAMVTVGGKVTTGRGSGIRSIVVTLTDMNGAVRTTFTGSFGAYRFTNVEVGQNYILRVFGKKYSFANPTQIISVYEELTNLDFVAAEQ